MKRILFLLFLSCSIAWSQTDVQLDSLKRIVFQEQLHDSLVTKSYVSLLKHYKRKNEDSCRVYFKRLKAYADRSESNLANYYFYRYNASYYGLFLTEGSDSFEYISSNLKKALSYAKNCENPKILSDAYSRLSQEYFRFGFNSEALEYANNNIEYSNKKGLWREAAYSYSSLSEIYLYGFNMTEKALEIALKSDSIFLGNNYNGEDRGFALGSIADIYKELGNLDEAEAYHKQAMDIYLGTENEYQQKSVLGSLASIARERKNYPKAIAYFEDCIAYYRENKYRVKEAMFHIGLSDVYFESNQIPKAIETAQTAVTLNRELNNDFGVLLGLINKSKFLLAADDYTASFKTAEEAKAIANGMNSYIDQRDALDLLAKSSEKLGRFEAAYNFSKEHKRVSDTLIQRENLQQTKTLEARYKNTQQQQEIQVLQSEKELVEEQKRNQRNLLIVIIGLVFLAGLVLFFLYRNRQKTNTKLRQLDAAKSTFFENISHEFRTPLSLIIGPLEKRLSDDSISEEDRNEFEMIQRNSNRLMELINQLLDISRLESRDYKLKVSQGNVAALLRSIAASFEFRAAKKDMTYEVSIQELESAWFDGDAIEKIVTNLLSNAFKYSPNGSKVTFHAISKNQTLEINVENNGVSFTSEELDTIFERFTRLKKESTAQAAGSGIGLSLVKELVELSHGTIKVENTSATSVKFTVSLPIEKNAFAENEIDHVGAMIDSEGVTSEVDAMASTADSEDIPLLLVVDDNDDIRSFISGVFKDHYNVLEAKEGKAGIALAIEHVPDIIISDIMMPNVTGIELCEQLKQDERTSHIPIILLTARVDEESQFKSLELGADDYMLKPFSTRLLETRVSNLVASRVQLRDRYSKQVILSPKDISISSFDEQFIEKLKKVLDDKITDDTFSIEELSQRLHMSRMQLHRKMKALTGLSASEFLRIERLKLALTLLEDKEVNINEVCYKVGFSTPSYFSKCFKETYGCSPSEYRAKS